MQIKVKFIFKFIYKLFLEIYFTKNGDSDVGDIVMLVTL